MSFNIYLKLLPYKFYYLVVGVILVFNYALSKNEFSEANEIYASLNDTWGIASAKLGLGKVILKEHDYINSEKELGSALNLFTSIGDKLGQANANKELGNLFKALNKIDDAKNYFNHALNLYETMKETSEAEKLQTAPLKCKK